MPNIDQMKKSDFLKKEDCGSGILVTMGNVEEQNIAMEGKPQDLKWCLHIEGSDKPLILNTTNMQLIAQIVGSKETDDWRGKKVVLYNDPSISFGGKLVGGIRVRAPKGQAPKPASQFQAEPEDDLDEPPF